MIEFYTKGHHLQVMKKWKHRITYDENTFQKRFSIAFDHLPREESTEEVQEFWKRIEAGEFPNWSRS